MCYFQLLQFKANKKSWRRRTQIVYFTYDRTLFCVTRGQRNQDLLWCNTNTIELSNSVIFYRGHVSLEFERGLTHLMILIGP